MGKRTDIASHWIKALTDRDFVVVSIDYRLCPQVSLHEGPVQDTRDAYHWCRKQLPDILKDDIGVELDSSRIVALGWSAGGHLSMMLGHESAKPCAILNCYGPLDFADQAYRQPVTRIMSLIPEGPLHFDENFMQKVYDDKHVLTYTEAADVITTNSATGKPEIDFSRSRNAWWFGNMSRGTWIEALHLEAKDFPKVDPALNLTADFPPTFFLWGEQDEVCPSHLAQKAHQKLKALGVETEIVLAEGYGHAFGAGLVEGTSEFERFVVKPLEFLASHAHRRKL
jgi:acetyl esterase/lipase